MDKVARSNTTPDRGNQKPKQHHVTETLLVHHHVHRSSGWNSYAQVSGNLLYHTNDRIFFQQAEQPMKASVQGIILVLEVSAMMNVQANSYLAIFHLNQIGADR
ncbi:MAG: hypothetical protein M3R08_06700 [Bacteroidota bacterium]|nr:hypothetical protein [Bacteroidota bacterium]